MKLKNNEITRKGIEFILKYGRQQLQKMNRKEAIKKQLIKENKK